MISWVAYWVENNKPQSLTFKSKLDAYRHIVSILEIDEYTECKVIKKVKLK